MGRFSIFAFAAVAACSPLLAGRAADPTCANADVQGAVSSISDAHPHPTPYCQNYLKVGTITVDPTTTVTLPQGTKTISTSVATAIYTTTTTTSTVTSLVTTCALGGTAPGFKIKRATSSYPASIVSQACSCIGAKAVKVTQTTSTATVSKSPKPKNTKTTETVYVPSLVTQTSTATTTVLQYATGSPFALVVASDSPPSSSNDQTGNYIQIPSNGIGNYVQFGPNTTTFGLTPCNELVVVSGAPGAVGNYLADYSSSQGNYMNWWSSAFINQNGYTVGTCSIDAATDMLSCTIGYKTLFGSYYNKPIMDQGESYFGSITYKAEYAS